MEESTEKRVLDELASTQYACSHLQTFSTRDGNLVFRAHLNTKFIDKREKDVQTVIVKNVGHAAPCGHGSTELQQRQTFDEMFLKAIVGLEVIGNSGTTIVRAPGLYHFSSVSGTHIQEDVSGTGGFTFMAMGAESETLFPGTTLTAIGLTLGSWLRAFHAWADAPEQAELRELLPQDDRMRKTKCDYTFNSFLDILDKFPELTEGHEEILHAIRDAKLKEFSQVPVGDGWGIVHGDLWGGNILVSNSGWKCSATTKDPNEIFIIDWELSQRGHRSYDVGQLIGDMYERKVYRNRDAAVGVIRGIIEGYGPMAEDMAFRVAIYVGVHLIVWYRRGPKNGPPKTIPEEVIMTGLKLGRDLVIKGWQKDKAFFQDTLLASLFA